MTDHLLQTIQSLFIVFVCMFVCVRNGERERERGCCCMLCQKVGCDDEPLPWTHLQSSIFLVACFQKKMILKVDCGRKYVRRSPSFFLWVLDASSCTFVHSCGSLWFECKYPAVPGDKKFNNVMQATRRFHWKFVRFWINFSKNRSQARSGERLHYNDFEIWTSYN